jgi:Zn-finger nucleic acid-binding protein
MQTTSLICPKCEGEMRSYERSGILVDQCQECRGIFLDRGELERLLDVEENSSRRSERDRPEKRHSDRYEDGRRKHRRRSSFEELLGD